MAEQARKNTERLWATWLLWLGYAVFAALILFSELIVVVLMERKRQATDAT